MSKQLKEGEADYTIDSSAVEDTGLQSVITKEFIRDLEPNLVAIQFLKVDTKLVGGAGTTREFRKRGAYADAADFSEGADVPTASTPARSTVPCKPTKFGVSETITEDAIDAADYSEIDETREDLALAMARRSDARIWNTIYTPVNVSDASITGDGATKKFALLNGHVTNAHILLQVNEVTVDAVAVELGVDCWVDMYLGRIEFATAPPNGDAVVVDYDYTALPNQYQTATACILGPKDLIRAKAAITSHGGMPNLACVHTDEANDLEADDQFIDAGKYGDNTKLLNGEIGKLSALNIIVSSRQYSGVAFVAQAGARLGYHVYKKKPVVKLVELETKSGDVLMKTWEKSASALTDNQVASVVTNGQYYAKSIPSLT